ncbi:MAG: DUF2207 domain-containing protein [Chloroflexota bacterium]|nr:DUF2207 domain-containing protein [Chloroflexota bacterium]
MKGRWSALAVGTAAVIWLLAFTAIVSAAAAPPFPDPQPDRLLYDTADLFPGEARRASNQVLRDLRDRTGTTVVVYTQTKPTAVTSEDATGDAAALLEAWELADTDATALVWNMDAAAGRGVIGSAATPSLAARGMDAERLRSLVEDATSDDLASGDWLAALTRLTVAISLALPPDPVAVPSPSGGVVPSPRPVETPPPGGFPGSGPAPAAGPPFPDPVVGQVVYDFADVLHPATEVGASDTIEGIEARTGAEVVVYTQVKPSSDTSARAEQDAIALMDQWGVGRAGFDDGLVILFDMDEPAGCHGQVQLYAGPGYRATFLSNEERQAIFEDEMLPLLRGCDLDGALGVALQRIDANATPEHAQTLERGRQVNAVLGLLGAPLAFLLLVGWAGSSWLRYGKDPIYLDDDSIHMSAPPAELTPAAGALLMDGRSSRRMLTTAMLHLASRGELSFRKHDGLLRDKVGVFVLDPDDDDPPLIRNRRKLPTSAAEDYALARLQTLGRKDAEGYIEPDELLEFGKFVDKFDDRVEAHVARQKWFREAPSKSIERWSFRGGIALVAGFVLGVVGVALPSSGILLVGVGVGAASVVVLILARVMPARTMPGAMLYAMLAAYRRTLHKTMEQARSMDQVVTDARLPWLETPDQAAVWSVALGLQDDVQKVLERSIEDVGEGRASSGAVWAPAWYGGGVAGAGAGSGSGGLGGLAPGLMAASAVPDFGGMMSAIGTIGDSPASSGSGSSGFSGGSGGGGGGGSGGGF